MTTSPARAAIWAPCWPRRPSQTATHLAAGLCCQHGDDAQPGRSQLRRDQRLCAHQQGGAGRPDSVGQSGLAAKSVAELVALAKDKPLSSRIPTMQHGNAVFAHFGINLVDGCPRSDAAWQIRYAISMSKPSVQVVAPASPPMMPSGSMGQAKALPSSVRLLHE